MATTKQRKRSKGRGKAAHGGGRSGPGWPDRVALVLIVVGLAVATAAAAWHTADVAAAPPPAESPGGESGHLHGIPVATSTGPAIAGFLVSLLGVFVAAGGLRRWLDERMVDAGGSAVFAASALLIADGVLHLYAIGDHLSHPPYPWFFLGFGIAQFGLAFLLLWERPSVLLLATLATVGLIAVYIASRIVAPPFSDQPEAIEVLGVLSKIVEVATLVPLLTLFFASRRTTPAEATGSRGSARKAGRARD